MYTDGILFDLDGTLWDSTELVADAWNEVIRKNTLLDLNLDGTRLKQLLGQLLPDIAAQIFPNCPKARQLELIDLCCQREHEVLSETCAPLYESLEQTLDELSNRFPLFIVSNCQAGYIETFLKTSHLEKYFKDHLCPVKQKRIISVKLSAVITCQLPFMWVIQWVTIWPQRKIRYHSYLPPMVLGLSLLQTARLKSP